MDQQGRRSEGLATTAPVDYGEVASDGSEASASDCDDSDDDSADGSDFEGEQDDHDASDASEASASDCSLHDSDDSDDDSLVEKVGAYSKSERSPSMAKRRRITKDDSDDADDTPGVSISTTKRKALAVLDSDDVAASDSADDGNARAGDDNVIDDEVATTNGIHDDNKKHVYSKEKNVATYGAVRMARVRNEWFSIYMDYLENCMMDPTFEANNRDKSFLEAEKHVERALCQRRDSLRSTDEWSDDLAEATEHCPLLHYKCQASDSSETHKLVHVRISGIRCGASKLFAKGWSTHFQACQQERTIHKAGFVLPSVCFDRVLLYWSLHQAKSKWCELILRMIQAAGGETPSEEARERLHAREFQRLQELESLVDKFLENDQRSNGLGIHNVWNAHFEGAMRA